MALLDDVRQAMRIRTEAFDTELQIYIDACIYDLKRLNIEFNEKEPEAEIKTAIILYVKAHFGTADASFKESMNLTYNDIVDRLRMDSSKKRVVID
jgi:hypothetical protein